MSVLFKSTNLYTSIDPLIYKAKPFPCFSVFVVRQWDRISNIFSFRSTILILLHQWRMEVRVLAFLWWAPLPGSVIVEDQGQLVKRSPVMLCWTAEELWQSESTPEKIGCYCLLKVQIIVLVLIFPLGRYVRPTNHFHLFYSWMFITQGARGVEYECAYLLVCLRNGGNHGDLSRLYLTTHPVSPGGSETDSAWDNSWNRWMF